MGKVGERAMTRDTRGDDPEKNRRPDYTVTVKVPMANDEFRYVPVGGAWRFDLREGGEGISVRINSFPLGWNLRDWDGTLSLMPRREEY